MKSPLLPLAAATVVLALHTSCKPKPAPAAAAEPTSEAAAAASAPDAAPEAPAPAPPANQLPPPPPQGNAGGNRPGGGQNFQQRAQERMQRMKTELGLNDDQVQKVQAVFDQQFGPLRQQTGDQSMSREDRRAAFEKARAAVNAQIDQILTPEQKPKWEAYQKEMEQRRQQGGNRQGGNRRNGGGGN